jgi:hypothetical protein
LIYEKSDDISKIDIEAFLSAYKDANKPVDIVNKK